MANLASTDTAQFTSIAKTLDVIIHAIIRHTQYLRHLFHGYRRVIANQFPYARLNGFSPLTGVLFRSLFRSLIRSSFFDRRIVSSSASAQGWVPLCAV